MQLYNHKDIEKKWQARWEAEGEGVAHEDSKKEKSYLLVEFPYPSGAGLHTGHVRSYTAMDIVARKRRREGKEVLYPIGWDAFGLPTENYAIKTGKNPRDVTKENTDTFRRQLKSLGLSFDWLREINTTDPAYYKWTQWIFLEMFKRGLAYKAKTKINWCPKCKIGLANEEVVEDACERCGYSPVEKREKEQWMLKITEYAQRLYNDLNTVDYIERAKVQQRNWIGPSEGAEIAFEIKNIKEKIEIFTTRPDTLFGATYLVFAPEHSAIENLKSKIENWDEVEAYIRSAKQKTDIERGAEKREKTGVELKGVKAINPATQEEIPMWIADYVFASYGTGAIMAVPAHDERDFEFAKKFKLPIRHVVRFTSVDIDNPPREGKEDVFRRIVHVVVRNKKGETLLLKWKGKAWDEVKRWPVTFLVGGIEEGEDPVEAALREVREEAGFTKLRHVQTLPVPARVRFYAAHKGVNRTADVYSVVLELEDETREAVSEEELEKHDAIFVPDGEVAKTLNIPDDLFFWKQITEPTAFAGEGMLINSGNFDGLTSEDAKAKITEYVGGKMVTTYKLRDWVFSRQRYWGEPIPLIFCEACGWQAVPEKDLPVELPKVEKYEPTDTGESPLANISEWVNTTCPKCGGMAKRETDVMPNWAGSSWYYLRYSDPQNKTALADKEKLSYWTPVDWYNGGMEHTTLHLLYSRFWHKFLYDIGAVPTAEPYIKRTSHGLILAEDGEKMSKSKGNTVNPDEIVERFGADALRVYEMFMGPFDQAIAWSTDGLVGAKRFLERVYKLSHKIGESESQKETVHLLHKTIKKVTEDIESLKMNTAISQLMILTNALEKLPVVPISSYQTFVQLLAPFAPHLAEELWEKSGEHGSIHHTSWPVFDTALLTEEEVTIAVQVNGKLRGTLRLPRDTSEKEIRAQARAMPIVLHALEGKEEKGTIFVPGKIINFRAE